MWEFDSVHHVQMAIPVGGEARCRQFWVTVLGMIEIAKPPNGVSATPPASVAASSFSSL
jgi:catechol 2,3-dioxygenase-like lactoylglutathione lyase family enzyme